MAFKLNFDTAGNLDPVTLVLCYRSGERIGAINNADNFAVTGDMGNPSEISFSVTKNITWIWDKIVDFLIVWVVEWDKYYEITAPINESITSVKDIAGLHLPEAELSQLNLYDIEINTDTDADYSDGTATVFFNEEDPSHSMLHRITRDKASHFIFGEIDESLRGESRTFSFNGTSICDSFVEISEELDCKFTFDSYTEKDGSIGRKINAYDLLASCKSCGHRGEFEGECPECKSIDIKPGYGEDTTIFLSRDNLVNTNLLSIDKDSVKNCFRLESADEVFDDAVMMSNPNGSRYIWHFSPEIRSMMSEDLRNKLNEYDEKYLEYQTSYEFNDIDVAEYNNLIDKYIGDPWDVEYSKITLPVVGFSNLISEYYNICDFCDYLETTMMPNLEMLDEIHATDTLDDIADYLTSYGVAVNSVTIGETTATNAVRSMADAVVDSRFKVSVKCNNLIPGPTISKTIDGVKYTILNSEWNGIITVDSYATPEEYPNEDKDLYTASKQVTLNVSTDYEIYLKNMAEKLLGKDNSEDYSTTGLFEKPLAEDLTESDEYENSFEYALAKYSRNMLSHFDRICEGILVNLNDHSIGKQPKKESYEYSHNDISTYWQIYYPYYLRSQAIKDELNTRERELAEASKLRDSIEEIQKSTSEIFNMQTFLGDSLWKELNSFRREDIYSNSNYSSEGLDKALLFDSVKQFMAAANRELIKSATLQHSISSTLKNLFVIKEFAPLTEHFEVGNWIRIEVNDEIYKLRLLSYVIDFEDFENSDVVFSDVIKWTGCASDLNSIKENVNKISSSYSYVAKQASKGAESKAVMDTWFSDSLNATNVNIVSSADNQDMVFNENGLLMRRIDEFTGNYDPEQARFINTTLAITDDNWKTIKTALGKFQYVNPENGELTTAYGLIGDTIVGNLFVGKALKMYNSTGTLKFDEKGFVVTTNGGEERLKIDPDGNINITPTSLVITSENEITIDSANFQLDSDGKVTMKSAIIEGDSIFKGSLTGATGTFSGTITASDGAIGGWNIDPDLLYSGGTGLSSNSGKYAFWAGETNGSLGMVNSNATFKVGHNGILYATGANISGTITAGANSKIGPWTISDTSIYKGSSTHGDSNGMYFGNSGLSVGSNFVVSSTGVLKASGADITGKITATSGTIGAINVISSVNQNSYMYGDGLYIQNTNIPINMWVYKDNSGELQELKVSGQFGLKKAYSESEYFLYYNIKSPSLSQWNHDSTCTVFGVKGNGKVVCHGILVQPSNGIKTSIDSNGNYGDITFSDGLWAMDTDDDSVVLNYVKFEPYSVWSSIISNGDAEYNLGESDFKWRNIYLRYSPHVSSDRNLKKNIVKLNDIHKQFFMKLIPVSFMFTDPSSDRTHIGFIAQDVEQAMTECGLTSLDFAGLCKDIKRERVSDNKWDKRMRDVLDENGNPVYIYSLRYTEFIGIITHVLQDTVNRLDKLEFLVSQLLSS